MSSIYLDTSALIKLYVRERDSEGVVLLANGASLLVASTATAAEVPAALAKGMRMGKLSPQEASIALTNFQQGWPDYYTIELGNALGRQAGALAWQHGLRGYDAVHLASGLTAAPLLGGGFVFATYDRDLWQAARSSGLDVYPADLEAVLAGV